MIIFLIVPMVLKMDILRTCSNIFSCGSSLRGPMIRNLSIELLHPQCPINLNIQCLHKLLPNKARLGSVLLCIGSIEMRIQNI